MKKKALVFTAIFAMLGNTAFAGTMQIKPLDLVTNTLTVTGTSTSGEAGERVILTVVNPNSNFSDGLHTDKLQQIQTGETGEGGAYSLSFELNTDTAATGYYIVYLAEENNSQILSDRFYYATEQTKKDQIDSINGYTEQEIESNVSSIILNFGLDQFAPATNASPAFIAKAIKKLGTLNNTDFDTLQTAVKEAGVIDMFNTANLDKVTDNNYNLLYDNDIGYSQIDTNGVTVYKAYTDIINTEGKKKVIESITNKNYDDIDELKEDLYESIFLNAVYYTDKSGVENMEQILTKENCSAVNMTLTNYFASDRKGSIHSAIASDSKCTTLSELETKLEALAKQYAQGNNQSSSGSGGTGGGTGGGSNKGSAAGSLVVFGETVNGNVHEEKADKVYSDVEEGMWAYTAIKYLNGKGIVAGYEDGSFKPDNEITREQFAKILCVAAGLTPVDEPVKNFDDVDYSAWYAPYIEALLQENIINGISDKCFGVGEKISRQDVCVMLYRLTQSGSIDEDVSFNDEENISDYAIEAVKYFAAKKIINGFPDGSFKPKNSCTRAQTCKIIYDYLNTFKNE